MTEKRFIYDAEQVAILKNGEFWLEGAIATACNHSEICNELNKLVDENEQLKAQLYCDSNEGVCIICKHHYVEKTNMFYISKCEKGHEKCSKESVRHCEDFKLK